MKSVFAAVIAAAVLADLPGADAAQERPAAPVQQTIPELEFDSIADFFKLPDGMNFGEVSGVAVNSKGHVFVFTRSNSAGGPAYAPTAAQLLEFNPRGQFVREIGKGLYAWSFAHTSGPSTRART
jgi:hypothetical protein